MPRRASVGILLLGLIAGISLAAEPRPLALDDLFALTEVGEPRVSPDGMWVAWTSTRLDLKRDASDSDLYLSPIAGGEALRLTGGKKDERSARFSPDGRWIAFLSNREGKGQQVWLLPRAGGEASRLTELKGGVSALAWSPDSRRLAVIAADPDPAKPEPGEDEEKDTEEKTAPPIVTRRLQFKRDYEGYLKDLRSHIHIVDLEKKTTAQLTAGPFDDADPEWSPDGRFIAFVSDRTLPDSDRTQNTDIFLVEAIPGSVPRPLTVSPGADNSPAFSPDGRFIAYVAGGDPKDLWYGASHLALVPASLPAAPARPLTSALDRNVLSPRFSADGRSIYFLLEEEGNQRLAKVGIDGGAVDRVVAGEREVSEFDIAPDGTIVVLESSTDQPAEISRVGPGGALSRVTRANDTLMGGLKLGRTERFRARGADGTPVDGFLVTPPGYPGGARLPAILRIHGGPASQFTTAFHFEWQWLAANGYAVIAANPRGSTGYGTAFSRAIWADWGNVDTADVLAAVDHAVGRGVADPERLGVGGWSYGGMLTNYVIARTKRFKAAVSGSSISNMLAGYGTDHYQYEYEIELGLPWKDRRPWDTVSHPFFNVESIETPTLFMCGQLDMNVPLLNTEQMYQALRRVGKADTELVIYPDQWHGIDTPSYQKDRLGRYVAWYDRYLKPPATARPLGVPPDRKPEAFSASGRPLFPPEPAAPDKARLEADLAKATSDFLARPDDAASILWLGRRLAYAGRYQEAIATFSRGIALHPGDARLLRHRGHRYITTRRFDLAVADLSRASKLVKGRADEPDPGSNPEAPTTTTLRYSIEYHLGLAHYLRGEHAGAERAWLRCLEAAGSHDEQRVAVLDWLYLALRRQGRHDEAARLVEPVHGGIKAGENAAYLNRILTYRGELSPEDLLRAGGDDLQRATYGYAAAMRMMFDGRAPESRALLEQVVSLSQWAAFGYIAAESELARSR